MPAAHHASTPLYILATAGLRLISVEAQNAMIEDVSDKIVRNYNFKFVKGRNFEIISGQMEGAFGTSSRLFFVHPCRPRFPGEIVGATRAWPRKYTAGERQCTGVVLQSSTTGRAYKCD